MADITNIILDRSIPEFIKTDYPMFQTFLAAYYEYLQQTGNPMDTVENLRAYTDIDQTLDAFLQHFMSTFASLIPYDIMMDKRLFIKHAKQFYSTKGTEASFRFLFRALYNEEIEFYYPKTDILKADDGKWQQTISIKILQAGLSNSSFLFTDMLSGAISHAKAHCEVILKYTERGTPIYELNLFDVRGKFVMGEEILFNGISHSPKIYVLEVVSGVNIINGGFQYKIGDIVFLRDAFNNKIGQGYVNRIKRGPIEGFIINNGGSNYHGEQREITDFAYLPIGYTLDGVYLPDAFIGGPIEDFSVESISHPITAQLFSDVGDSIKVTDEPDPIGIDGAGIVSLVDMHGVILETRVLTGGKNYQLPIAEVISKNGSGADLTVIGGGGDVVAVQLESFPIVERDNGGNDYITVDFTPSKTGAAAIATGILNGGMITYPGFWANDDGRLDTTKKLQDNNFYQDFSYVIISKISHEKWKDIIGKIAHPAGFQEFGKVKAKSFNTMVPPTIEEVVHYTVNGTIYIDLAEGGRFLFTDGGYLITS
jgi:hypothetical protein